MWKAWNSNSGLLTHGPSRSLLLFPMTNNYWRYFLTSSLFCLLTSVSKKEWNIMRIRLKDNIYLSCRYNEYRFLLHEFSRCNMFYNKYYNLFLVQSENNLLYHTKRIIVSCMDNDKNFCFYLAKEMYGIFIVSRF